MKISYKHLIDKIPTKPSIEELSSKLFQLGHENEIIGNIIDLELTPNRGDCLSLTGILRDLKIFYDDIDTKNKIYEKNLKPFEFNFENEAISSCSEISFLKIEIKDIDMQYKGALKDYFEELNLKKNNFFTDISNYISYETGQPTHCYEAFSNKDVLTLEFIEGEYDFISLMDKKVKLDERNLVFKLNNKIINLAGVIGSKNSSCSVETKSVIIECACFNSEHIIGQALKYDIQSEAAHKFERGVDQKAQEYALRRFLQVVSDYTEIVNIEFYTQKYSDYIEKTLPFDVDKINQILGINLNKNSYLEYLLRLGFKITNEVISIPSYRNDITSENDVAEEIARSIGYNNIKRKKIDISVNASISIDRTELELKNKLAENGFFEVINNPFTSNSSETAIIVDNPLDSNRMYLRTELKKSLINNLLYNQKRQKDIIKLYEISDIYLSTDGQPSKKSVGIIASGRIGKNYLEFSKKIDKLYLLNVLETIIDTKKIDILDIPIDELDTKIKNNIYYVEFEFNTIKDREIFDTNIEKPDFNFKKYQQISEFPSSYRDLSFSINDSNKYKILESHILNFKNKILKDKFIFDFYKNEKNNEIKIGFRFIFQSNKKTITDIEVSDVMNKIIESSMKIDSVSIPGLKT